MRIEQFESVLATARSKSMKKAAELTHSSVQNISIQISNLEKELNTSIFVRNRYGVFLTPDGEYICQELEKIMSLVSGLQTFASDRSGLSQEHEKVISSFNILASPPEGELSSSIIKRLCTDYNISKASIATHDAARINTLLNKNLDHIFENYDLIFTNMLPAELLSLKKDLKCVPCYSLSSNSLGIHLSTKNPLSQKKAISITELINQSLILRTYENDNDDNDNIHLLNSVETLGVVLKPKYRLNSEKVCVYFIENDMGYSISPYSSASDKQYSEKSVVVPLKEKLLITHLAFFNPLIAKSPLFTHILSILRKKYPHMHQLF